MKEANNLDLCKQCVKRFTPCKEWLKVLIDDNKNNLSHFSPHQYTVIYDCKDFKEE